MKFTTLEQAEQGLQEQGVLTFGIESIECWGRSIRYVNRGDTYAETILEENGELFTGSWGGWLEEVETDYCEDNEMIRCGHCGEFSPVASDWRNTVCEHCGNLVGG
jgi:hypothetical protein